jgi:CubicO group peptidase (beta-lactamase class C family)
VLASAGKFITHVAALQLVERGKVKLDEPVYKHLPELEDLPLLSHGGPSGDLSLSLSLCKPANPITLRHLLLHTSGLSDPEDHLVAEYLASETIDKPKFTDGADPIVKHFSIPLVFEPGDGFAYGHSIHWTQLLVKRLSDAGNFVKHIEDHIFAPLAMRSSTYAPQANADVWDRRLRMVERDGDRLIPADDASQGLTCSMTDIGAILSDLVSPAPKLLKQDQHIGLLFAGQFLPSSASLNDLRGNQENYRFCAGMPPAASGPLSLNWSAAGLVVECEELPLSRMPRGTVTWEGMPNVMWAMNREKGLGMFFATQLLPVGDRHANELALEFMSSAWSRFG